VSRVSAEDAVGYWGQAGTTFVDVRDSGAIAQSGTVKGALRIPRGMIEFAADDTSKLHNENLNKDDRICLICAAGGQAALAGKTMVDMGYTNVVNVGGFADWQAAGGETEE
jgi:rhodanese-related sulfurtransferase